MSCGGSPDPYKQKQHKAFEGGLQSTVRKLNFNQEEESNRSYLDKSDMTIRPLNQSISFNHGDIIHENEPQSDPNWLI